MEDIKAKKETDTASDHHLMVVKMKLTTGATVIQEFNTAFLRDTGKLNEFKTALNNKSQASQNLLGEEEIIIENNW